MSARVAHSSERIHEIRKTGSLYFLLNAFIGAYNRRTDAQAKGLQAIALALSTPQDNSVEVQKKIDEAAASITAEATDLQSAIDAAK